ncbi:hypothetical protein ACLOJK_007413 [Asimina triloba]
MTSLSLLLVDCGLGGDAPRLALWAPSDGLKPISIATLHRYCPLSLPSVDIVTATVASCQLPTSLAGPLLGPA